MSAPDKEGSTEWVDGKYSFKLSQPITTEEGETWFVPMRTPTGADLIAVGNPVEFNPISDPPTLRIKDKEMAAMVARVSNIAQPFLGKITPKDLINLGWVLAPFFMPV